MLPTARKCIKLALACLVSGLLAAIAVAESTSLLVSTTDISSTTTIAPASNTEVETDSRTEPRTEPGAGPKPVMDSVELAPKSGNLASSVGSNGLSPVSSEWPFVVLSLVAIVALILALGWAARRMGGLGAMGVRDMKVLSAIPVGNREKVALIDVAGTQLLVGITSHNINHLHTFDKAVVETKAAPKASDFSRTLQSMLRPSQDSKNDDA